MRVAFLGQGSFAKPIEQKIGETFGLVSACDAEVVVVASWGKILSKEEIEQPKYGTLNIHPSLLPKYRGATPIQWSIINGDHETGVSIIKMDQKVDHGPILAQQKVAITRGETNDSLTRKLAKLGADMIVGLLPQYIDGKVKPIEQDHLKATFVYRFKKEDGLLNLNDSALINERKVRALWPWPGTYTTVYPEHSRRMGGQKLFIHRAHIESNKFVPDVIQLEGRKKMPFDEFRRGWRGVLF